LPDVKKARTLIAEWQMTASHVEWLRRRKYPRARPDTKIQKRPHQLDWTCNTAQIAEISTMAPVGPRKDRDQPRNMKPRQINSSIIGAVMVRPTKKTNNPPTPPKAP